MQWYTTDLSQPIDLHVLTPRFIRAARQALEEDSGLRRETLAVADLLKDTAGRSKQAENSKQGLPSK
jgi:hypothetical protein